MLARLSFALVISSVLLAPQRIGASPITYDFAGTLSQPIDGATQFSGSFTIDTNPNQVVDTIWDNASAFGEDGSEVALTIRLGGQTMNYINTPQNPETVTLLGETGVNIAVPPPPQNVYFGLGTQSQANDRLTFSLQFTRPGSDLELADLARLSSPMFTSSVSVSYDSAGQTQQVQGSITSIEQVSAPEPGMLAIFAVMGFAGLAHRRFRRSG